MMEEEATSIRLNWPCSADCLLCGVALGTAGLVRMFIGEHPICTDCGRLRAPFLAALVDLATVIDAIAAARIRKRKTGQEAPAAGKFIN